MNFSDLADPIFELLQVHLRERVIGYEEDALPLDVQAIVETLRMRIVPDDTAQNV